MVFIFRRPKDKVGTDPGAGPLRSGRRSRLSRLPGRNPVKRLGYVISFSKEPEPPKHPGWSVWFLFKPAQEISFPPLVAWSGGLVVGGWFPSHIPSIRTNENRNLMWTKRGKACLILIFSTNTNCEHMAYRSFRSEKYSARAVRKVTTGTAGLLQPSVHSHVAG